MRVAVLLALTTACSCSIAPDPNEEAVKLLLTDPASAQFRGVKEGSKPEAVCGEVNAKNQMGGYAGFAPFVVANGVATIKPSAGILLTDIDKLNSAASELRFLGIQADAGCISG